MRYECRALGRERRLGWTSDVWTSDVGSPVAGTRYKERTHAWQAAPLRNLLLRQSLCHHCWKMSWK